MTDNPPETLRVDLMGLETAYTRSGTGDPVLFLTGQGYAGMWIPLYDRLSGSFDLIVPDHPGFGATEMPDHYNDFNDLSVHYAALLDALGVAAVHVIGHAFGGWVAAEFAAMYPERVSSLTLIAPSGLMPDEDEPMPDPYRMSREKWLEEALGDGAAEAISLQKESDLAMTIVQDYKERIGVARVAWNPRYSLRLPWRMGRLKVPSQVLVPEVDRLTLASVARKLAELLDCDSPVTITSSTPGKQTQHLVVLQEPDALYERIFELTAS